MIDNALTEFKIFVDTNFLRGLNEDKLDVFRFSSEFQKLVNYVKKLSHFVSIKICLPDIVVDELCELWVNAFRKRQKEIEITNQKYEKIFSDKLQGRLSTKFVDDEAYCVHILDSIKQYFEKNESIIETCKTPNCLEVLLARAVKKEPPFVTAKKDGKEYHDAGLKDNVIFETFLVYKADAEGCFITSDSDFNVVNSSICIIKDLNQLKEWLKEKEPTIQIIEIVLWLNEEENKRKILDFVKPEERDSSNLEITGYDKDYCKLNNEEIEEEVQIEQIFSAKLCGCNCRIRVIYNLTADDIILCELTEE